MLVDFVLLLGRCSFGMVDATANAAAVLVVLVKPQRNIENNGTTTFLSVIFYLFYSRDPRLSLNLIKDKKNIILNWLLTEILRPVSVLFAVFVVFSSLYTHFTTTSSGSFLLLTRSLTLSHHSILNVQFLCLLVVSYQLICSFYYSHFGCWLVVHWMESWMEGTVRHSY